ncbi:hypothetical protein, partial [Pseudomonas syringae group genomosp. 7]|uniref:hypothetical protein n=1 Tax=Pseudomonas syringae group genomosp. 7 TaxID=251699 RepID=UPI00376FE540
FWLWGCGCLCVWLCVCGLWFWLVLGGGGVFFCWLVFLLWVGSVGVVWWVGVFGVFGLVCGVVVVFLLGFWLVGWVFVVGCLLFFAWVLRCAVGGGAAVVWLCCAFSCAHC